MPFAGQSKLADQLTPIVRRVALFCWLLHSQLPAINLRPMRDVQRAVIGTGENGGCQRLTGINLWKNSARAASGASGVEDLDSKFAGDVVAADFIDSHAVTFGDRDIGWCFAEFEFAFLVDR